eukprot:11196856-Lingulodinium_polyedra.AAC.1
MLQNFDPRPRGPRPALLGNRHYNVLGDLTAITFKMVVRQRVPLRSCDRSWSGWRRRRVP